LKKIVQNCEKPKKIKVPSLGMCVCNKRERLESDSSSTRTVDRIYFLKKVGLEQDHRSYIILKSSAEKLLVLSVACGDSDENDDTTPKPRTAGRETYAGDLQSQTGHYEGIESTTMLVAVAPDYAKIQLLELPAGLKDGEVISFEGMEPVDFGDSKARMPSTFGIGFRNRGNEAVYVNGDEESAFTTRLRRTRVSIQNRIGDNFYNGVTIQKPSPRMVGAGHHPFSEETLGERQYNYILGE